MNGFIFFFVVVEEGKFADAALLRWGRMIPRLVIFT